MARTVITATVLTRNADTAPPAFVAADAVNGMQVVAGLDSRLYFHVKNTDVAAKTVTVKGRTYPNGVVNNSLAVTVGASSERLIGPFETGFYEQVDENYYIDFSAATGVTVAAIQLPK